MFREGTLSLDIQENIPHSLARESLKPSSLPFPCPFQTIISASADTGRTFTSYSQRWRQHPSLRPGPCSPLCTNYEGGSVEEQEGLDAILPFGHIL